MENNDIGAGLEKQSAAAGGKTAKRYRGKTSGVEPTKTGPEWSPACRPLSWTGSPGKEID